MYVYIKWLLRIIKYFFLNNKTVSCSFVKLFFSFFKFNSKIARVKGRSTVRIRISIRFHFFLASATTRKLYYNNECHVELLIRNHPVHSCNLFQILMMITLYFASLSLLREKWPKLTLRFNFKTISHVFQLFFIGKVFIRKNSIL